MTPIPLESIFVAASALISISGVVFKAGKLEEHLNSKIDKSRNEMLFAIDGIKDTITTELASIKQQLAVHLTDYTNKMDGISARITALETRSEKRLDRLEKSLDDVQSFLMPSAVRRRTDDE